MENAPSNNEASSGTSALSAEFDGLKLQVAVTAYHAALVACDSCTAMLLSSGSDPEPARLMEAMALARARMFDLALIKTPNV